MINVLLVTKSPAGVEANLDLLGPYVYVNARNVNFHFSLSKYCPISAIADTCNFGVSFLPTQRKLDSLAGHQVAGAGERRRHAPSSACALPAWRCAAPR